MNKLKTIISILAFMFCHQLFADNVLERMGSLVKFEKQKNGVMIQSTNGVMKLEVYDAQIIRIHISRDSVFNSLKTPAVILPLPADSLYKIVEGSDKLIFSTDSLKLMINKSNLALSFFSHKKGLLCSDDNTINIAWQNNMVSNYKKLSPEEKILGLGEKRGNVNRVGNSFTNWNDANDRLLDMQYKSFPFFISYNKTATYGIFVDQSSKSYFDFEMATEDKMYGISIENDELNYYFFGAQGIGNILQDYHKLVGKTLMPPLWSLGYQYGRRDIFEEKYLYDLIKKFEQEHIPISVLNLDIDALDELKNFTWDTNSFPNLQKMVEDFNAKDVHLSFPLLPWEKNELKHRIAEEGASKGYYAKYSNGKNYIGSFYGGNFFLVDFTQEDANRWWEKNIESLTKQGIEGFFSDMNEPSIFGENVPNFLGLNKGKSSLKEIRNQYGLLMSKATFEGLQKSTKKRPFLMSRAGFSGAQRYTAFWTGYNIATDEQMISSQKLLISLGYSGVSLAGADIGGFLGDPSPELLTRWTSIAVFNPLFRNNANTKSKFREPWNYEDRFKQIMKKDINLRYKLMPYIYNMVYQSQTLGLPLVRGLAFQFPNDALGYHPDYDHQFMFGDAFLIIPTESTKSNIKIHLPEGEWYRFSNDTYFEGLKEIEVNAPLEDLPVFVKGSSLVSMQHVDSVSQKLQSEVMEIHLWNGLANSEQTLYEDDGTSFDYEKNIFYARKIKYDAERRILFLDPPQGTYKSKYSNFLIVFHGFKSQIMQIKLNGVSQAIKIDARTNLTSVLVPNDPKQLVVGF